MPDEDIVQMENQTQQPEQVTVNVASVEDVGMLKKRVTVEIPASEIAGKLNSNFGEIANTAQVPGFRIGRAPRKLIEKRFGKDVREQVRLNILAAGVEKAIEQSELRTIGEPDFDHEKIPLPDEGPLTFSFDVEVEPDFDLPDLEGIEINEQEKEVTDKDVDEQIENIRWRQAVLEDQSEDAKVEKSDNLVCDTKIEVGDEPPILHHDADFVVRDHAVEGILFEGIDSMFEGASVGDSREVTSKVGDDHENEAWRGKEATLAVTIKKIAKWRLPDLNDELASQVGFDNVDAWRQAIRTELGARKGQQMRRDMEDQIRKYLLDRIKCELPERLTQRQTDRALVRRVIQLRQMGIPQVLIEEKLDDLRTRARDQAVEDLKFGFIASKIARHYEIKTSDEEVNSCIAGIAMQQGRRPERVREEMARDGSIGSVFEYVAERKVLEKLLESAKIVKKSA